jgi:hypothetical protein
MRGYVGVKAKQQKVEHRSWDMVIMSFTNSSI